VDGFWPIVALFTKTNLIFKVRMKVIFAILFCIWPRIREILETWGFGGENGTFFFV